jgi:hypothetical protein
MASGCAVMPRVDWPSPADAALTSQALTSQALTSQALTSQALTSQALTSRALTDEATRTLAAGHGVVTALRAPDSWQGASGPGYPTLSLAASSAPSRIVAPPMTAPAVLTASLQRYINGLPTTLPRLAMRASTAGVAVADTASSLFAAPALVRRTPRLQCVPYARLVSGIEIYGNANTWWRQAEGRFLRNGEPAIGAVIAMRGYRNPDRGHVAVVTGIRSDREILIDHANWLNRGEITISTPVLDVSKAGDWSKVRVWHIPSGRWGARIYSVHGFIHQG